MKRLCVRGFCVCMICWAAGLLPGCSDNDGASRTPAQMAIMVTGDLESRIVPEEVVEGGESVSLGGLARIAAAAQSIRGTVDGSLLLSAGNDVLGSFYYMFEGEPEMQGMDPEIGRYGN